jgi:CheY-like chemotaxis protein
MLVEEALKAQAMRYTMTHFKDGVEALNALTNEAISAAIPDVIVLDLNMPRMGGLELLATLKRNRILQDVPVAILTSSLQPEEKEQARRLGANRFVRKPVDLYDFLDQVGNALRHLIEDGRKGELTWTE